MLSKAGVCLIKSRVFAPSVAASQAASESEVISQEDGISDAGRTMAEGNQTGSFFPRTAPDLVLRASGGEPFVTIEDDVAELVHRKDRHRMRGCIRKAHALLPLAHLSAKGPPPGTMTSGRRGGGRADIHTSRSSCWPCCRRALRRGGSRQKPPERVRLKQRRHSVAPFLSRAGRPLSSAGAAGSGPRRSLGALALDLDAHAARPSSSFSTLTVTRMTRGSSSTALPPFGQRLAQLDMAVRDDRAYAVHDDVVGKHVAHVFGAAGRRNTSAVTSKRTFWVWPCSKL